MKLLHVAVAVVILSPAVAGAQAPRIPAPPVPPAPPAVPAPPAPPLSADKLDKYRLMDELELLRSGDLLKNQMKELELQKFKSADEKFLFSEQKLKLDDMRIKLDELALKKAFDFDFQTDVEMQLKANGLIGEKMAAAQADARGRMEDAQERMVEAQRRANDEIARARVF